MAMREKKISRSSFPIFEKIQKTNNKSLQTLPNNNNNNKKRKLKNNASSKGLFKGLDGIETASGSNAIVLASTSTQHSLGLIPVEEGVNRIRSALLEGYVVRRVEGGVSITILISHPSKLKNELQHMKGRKKKNIRVEQSLVNDDGSLHDMWVNVLNENFEIMKEKLSGKIENFPF